MLIRIKDQITAVARIGITPEHLEIIGLEPSIARGCANVVDVNLTEAMEKQFSGAFSSFGRNFGMREAVQSLISSSMGASEPRSNVLQEGKVGLNMQGDHCGYYPAQGPQGGEVPTREKIPEISSFQSQGAPYAPYASAPKLSSVPAAESNVSSALSPVPKIFYPPPNNVSRMAMLDHGRVDGKGDSVSDKVLYQAHSERTNNFNMRDPAPSAEESSKAADKKDLSSLRAAGTHNPPNILSSSKTVKDVRYSANQITAALRKMHGELEKHKVKLEEKINMNTRKRAAAFQRESKSDIVTANGDNNNASTPIVGNAAEIRANKAAKTDDNGSARGSPGQREDSSNLRFLPFKVDSESENTNNPGDIIVDYEGLNLKNLNVKHPEGNKIPAPELGNKTQVSTSKLVHDIALWPMAASSRTQRSKNALTFDNISRKPGLSHPKDKLILPRFQRMSINLKINNKQEPPKIARGPKSDDPNAIIAQKKKELLVVEESLNKCKNDILKFSKAIKEGEDLIELNKKNIVDVEKLRTSLSNERNQLVKLIEAEQMKILNQVRLTSIGKNIDSTRLLGAKNIVPDSATGESPSDTSARSNDEKLIMEVVLDKINKLQLSKKTASFIVDLVKHSNFTLKPPSIRDSGGFSGYPESNDHTIIFICSMGNRIVIPLSYLSVSVIGNEIGKYCGRPNDLSVNVRSCEHPYDSRSLLGGSKVMHENSIPAEQMETSNPAPSNRDRTYDIPYVQSAGDIGHENTRSMDSNQVETVKPIDSITPHLNSKPSSAEIFDIFTNPAVKNVSFLGYVDSIDPPSSPDIGTSKFSNRRCAPPKNDHLSVTSSLFRTPVFLERVKNLISDSYTSDYPGRYFDRETSFSKLKEIVYNDPTNEDAWVKYALKYLENGITAVDLASSSNRKIIEAANILKMGLGRNPKSALLWNTLLELRCRGEATESVRKLFMEATKSVDKVNSEQIYWRWVLWESDYNIQLSILDAMIKSFAETYIMMVQPISLADQFPPAISIFDVLVYRVWLTDNCRSVDSAIDYLYMVLTSTSIFDIINPVSEKSEKLLASMMNIKSTLPLKYFSNNLAVILWLIYFYMVYFRTFPSVLMGTYPYHFTIESRPFLVNWRESAVSRNSLPDSSVIISKSLNQFITLVRAWGQVNSVESSDYALLMLNLAALYQTCKKHQSQDTYFESTYDLVYDLFEDAGVKCDLSRPQSLHHIHVSVLEMYGNSPKALTVAKLILNRTPKDTILWSMAARIAIRLGQLPEAIACLVNCSFAVGSNHQLLSMSDFFDILSGWNGDRKNVMDVDIEGVNYPHSSELIDKALDIYERLLGFAGRNSYCCEQPVEANNYADTPPTSPNPSGSPLVLLCLNYISLFVIHGLCKNANTEDIKITCSRMFQQFEKNIQLTSAPDDEERVFWREYVNYCSLLPSKTLKNYP